MVYLICNKTSHDHVFKELSDVLGGRPLTLQERVVNGSCDLMGRISLLCITTPIKLGNHRHYDSRDISYLICHETLQNH